MVEALAYGETVHPEDFVAMGRRLLDALQRDEPIDSDDLITFVAFALSLMTQPS